MKRIAGELTRQPFAGVQSSKAIQAPTALGGSVYKKVESLWHGTTVSEYHVHPEPRRPTDTTNPRLFTDNHTLQYLCTLEMPQILRDIPDAPIFKRIFPKYGIKYR